VGPDCSYWYRVHSVNGAQRRSDVWAGAVASYCVAEHSVMAAQTRSAFVVGADFWYRCGKLHSGLMGEHLRSWVAVGACDCQVVL
jgi:hypothetical protein